MNTIFTILLAVFVPVLWGLLSAWAFDRLRSRRECSTQNQDTNQSKKPG